jgi:hypothetical protein
MSGKPQPAHRQILQHQTIEKGRILPVGLGLRSRALEFSCFPLFEALQTSQGAVRHLQIFFALGLRQLVPLVFGQVGNPLGHQFYHLFFAGGGGFRNFVYHKHSPKKGAAEGLVRTVVESATQAALARKA